MKEIVTSILIVAAAFGALVFFSSKERDLGKRMGEAFCAALGFAKSASGAVIAISCAVLMSLAVCWLVLKIFGH